MEPKRSPLVEQSCIPDGLDDAAYEAQVIAYWTRERCAAARPLPPPELSAEEQAELAALPPPAEPPRGDTTRPVANVHAYPWAAAGRLYATLNGADWWTSASCVGGQLVLTAGHCVYFDHVWARSIAFMPQYVDGESAGIYPANRLWLYQAFLVRGKLRRARWDIAFFTTFRPMAGIPILLLDFEAESGNAMALGYPYVPSSSHDFDGKVMWQASGPYQNSHNMYYPHLNVMSNNAMTRGASGGPWLDVDRANRVVGVTTVASGIANWAYSPLMIDAYPLYAAANRNGVSWAAALPSGAGATSTWFQSDRVYAASNGRLSALNPVTGESHGNVDLDQGDHEARICGDGQSRMFCGIHGYVVGVDGATLQRRWTESLHKAGYNVVDVLYSHGHLFAGSDGYAYRLDPGDGHTLARNNLDGFGHDQVSLAADDSNLYVGSNGRVGRIALGDFESLSWSRELEDSGASVDVLLRGATLYAGSNGQIFQLNAHSGEKLDTRKLTGQSRLIPLAQDEDLLFAANSKSLWALDPDSLDVRWTIGFGRADLSTVPSLSRRGGMLLVGADGCFWQFTFRGGMLLQWRRLDQRADPVAIGSTGARVLAGIDGLVYGHLATNETNLIKNWSFETGTPAPWHTAGAVTIDRQTVHSGHYAARLAPGGSLWQQLRAPLSTTYQLGAYIASSDGAARLAVEVDGHTTSLVASSGSYDRYVLTFTAAANAIVKVTAELPSGSSNAWACYDDFSLTY